jgi:starch phosphorylase
MPSTDSPRDGGLLVAYFSAEFGVDETLPVYSGGLGVLAADHLKSASDLGVPLVGVGLLYRRGYFAQGLDASGRQVESYPELDPARLPLIPEMDERGAPLLVEVELAGETVAGRVWRADVGVVPLYLLDTDVEENSPAARSTTDVLYGGDREHRLRQELVLGIGGVRALEALGLRPTVFHMNEGHAAFIALERIRALVAAGLSFSEALEVVRASTVFTTHTPVPAGNEVFEPELVRSHVEPVVLACGLSWPEFLALGRADDDGPFGLTPLALRTSARANGVSELHGDVARRMWAGLWPGRPVENVPIGHVTNGVHARTWLAPGLERLLRARGVRPEAPPAEQVWEGALELDGGELWRVHLERKAALAELVRGRGLELDADALAIGFARRFATYKRAGLLFSDPERLAALLDDPERPLLVVVAGKAHPADEGGKDLIQQILDFARDARAAGRVVFLEGYDIALARMLVQGVDVWLNTPRRPLEASGTSGMKAGLNGVLNLSVLDGWWCEGYAPELGWALGAGTEGLPEPEQDECDREELFRLLEREVVPAYYERDESGLPRRWLDMARRSIANVGERFSSHRMVLEYLERYYLPAHEAAAALVPVSEAGRPRG